MEPSNSLERFTDIIKSPTDHRHYAMVRLPNGLRCALVHDPDAQQSTAAVAVAAGHFQDPNDTQGLAHFLEHMLFLGTHKYPEATAYQDFTHQHGGHHNAWTGTEYSSYYCSVDATSFAAALDRFSRFFYEPTFNPEWIAKEVNAIESEFQMKRKDELRRLYQVHKATANPAHPFSKFSVGNFATLTENGDTTGLDHRMREFFATWYRANRMTLVLAGPQSLDELEQLAHQHFSAIVGNGPSASPEQAALYLPEQRAVQLNVRPLKDARRLILAFALPSIDDDYPYKTTSFIAHLLGYEGPGSLYAELHHANLINSLAAGGGISGSNFKDFNLNMQLTAEGLAKTDQIIMAVLGAVERIKNEGLEDWRYRERQVAIANAFRFQEPARTADLAPQLAINMHHYEPHDLIFGDYRMDQLNTTKARELLNLMHVDNLRATLIHREVEVDQHEPIYGTDYQLRPFTEEQKDKWRNAQTKSIQLPAPNPYLHPLSSPLPLEEPISRQPQCYQLAEGLTLWHLQDPDFRAPKAHIYCQFTLPNVTASARHYASARLWCELMIDRLNEDCYDAEIAGLHFNIYPQHYGITLHISGYSQGIVELSKDLLQRMRSTSFSDSRFADIKQKLCVNWQSALANKPLNLLFARLNVLLQPHMYALSDLAEALDTITRASFDAWHEQLFAAVELKLFAHGDLTPNVLKPLTDCASQSFSMQADLQANMPATRDLEQLKHAGKLDARGQLETHHSDHAAMLVIQGPDTSVLQQTNMLLLNQFIQPHLFNELRTRQQLGYLVGSTYMPIEQRPHLLMYVQSSNQQAEHLCDALDEFRQHFLSQFDDRIHDELEQVKGYLIRKLREPDTNLRLRSQRLWSTISPADVSFDRLEQMALELESNTTLFFIKQLAEILATTGHHGYITATPKEL
ncbi:insulinase family protein [Pseudidiomarina homiensis]|uniref:Protease 3 n=1 Tax=Pseudidiomarina homiensis TaxID=364198 RepID=A0A432Y573_9GAMM|nr:insulinase family protein [Pseudidiomarina homiensis]RUO56073.1 peptidase M16 [Pseudidiomarina homiensis]